MKTAVKQGRARKLSPRRYALPDTLYALASQLIDASNKASPLTDTGTRAASFTGSEAAERTRGEVNTGQSFGA